VCFIETESTRNTLLPLYVVCNNETESTRNTLLPLYVVCYIDTESSRNTLLAAQQLRELQHENYRVGVLLMKQQHISKWRLSCHRVLQQKMVNSHQLSSKISFISRFYVSCLI